MAKRKFSRQVFEKGRKTRWVINALKIFGLFVFFAITGVFSLFIFYAKDLPRPEKFTDRPFVESTKIYDRTGKVILYEIYGEEKRKVVALDTIPERLKQMVILTEDENFYHHFGVDPKAIGRAILVDLKMKEPAQGASTISQQLIRSSFLSLEKTPKRKIREIILTLEIERRYSKDQILEFYLNQVPFGSNAYGVETASQTFFQKPVKEISLAEAAILTALIRSPSSLSPYGERKDELMNRKNFILSKMETAGILTHEETEAAKKEEIKFVLPYQLIKAPHFTLYVKKYLDEKYSQDYLREKGLQVYTTLDWELQQLAEKEIKEGTEVNKNYQAFNAALTAINPNSGEILAMVGSKDFFADPYPKDCVPGKTCFFEPEFNVATSLPGRQPGSAFKPFVYATAFKKGYNDKTVVIDEETNFGYFGGKPYIPQNYDGFFRGPVTLRQALGQSLNVPSVKVLRDLAGLEDSITTAKELGITTLTRGPSWYGLSLVLGGGEVKLLDMVSSYGVFATGGLRVPPVTILKITDRQGNIIEENILGENKRIPKRVLDEKVANLITDILSDNEARAPIFGPRSPLFFENFKVATKTGTTEDYKDGWIIGYTSSFAAGVWVGNNNNALMKKEPGVVVAAPMWHRFFEQALSKYPP